MAPKTLTVGARCECTLYLANGMREIHDVTIMELFISVAVCIDSDGTTLRVSTSCLKAF